MEIVHAMVRGRAVGKGLVQTGTSLAAYPTAEDVGRHVRRRSASPVRMARLDKCRIRVLHDDTYIHHSMSEVVTLQ